MAAAWIFVLATAVYGAVYLVFAFVEPPAVLRSFFRVPAIFVFLPDTWVKPAGRVFVGLCCFLVAGMMVWKVLLQ